MKERLLPIPDLTVFDQARFWDFIKITETCWLWTGALYDKRYGRFSIKAGSFTATRVIYKLYTGKDPGEMLVCHECNNTICANPRHLFLGTNSDNQLHRSDSGRNNQDGELNPRAKLRESDVRSILKAIDAGESRTVLAKTHLVSIGTIHQVARRQIWRHVLI